MEEVDEQREEYSSRGHENWDEGEGEVTGNDNNNSSNGDAITNLYVKQLTPETTEEQLRAAFEKFGEIASCSVILEPGSNISRGFGFVAFKTVQESERALEAMNGVEINGRPILVEKARRMGGHAKTPGRYLGPAQNRRGRLQDERPRGRDYDRDYRGPRDSRGPPGDRYDRDYREYRDRDRDRDYREPARPYRDYDRDYRAPPPADYRAPPPDYRGPPPGGYRDDYDRRRPPPQDPRYDYADRRGPPPPRDDRRDYDYGRPPTRY